MVLPPSKKVYRQNRSFLGCWPKAGFMGAWTVCVGGGADNAGPRGLRRVQVVGCSKQRMRDTQTLAVQMSNDSDEDHPRVVWWVIQLARSPHQQPGSNQP